MVIGEHTGLTGHTGRPWVVSLLVCASACWAGCTGSEEPVAPEDAGVDAPSEAARDGWGTYTGTMSCGALPVANPACASCADDRCCAAGEACSAGQECVNLRTCFAACAELDTKCLELCRSEHGDGNADNAALSACMMKHCGDACFDGLSAPCGFDLPPASCNACAQDACCDVGWQANAEPSFWAYADCVSSCTETSCFEACAETTGGGRSYYYAFVGCLGTHCADPCSLGGTATCGGFYGSACGGCVQANCCEASLACFRSVACVDLLLCSESCGGDETCDEACQQAHPDGVEDYTLLHDCTAAACADSCP